ncbi:hypothetical protein HDU87_000185 [Geranomyces variabilis]|uniref:Uncharacterized protein n=1 Tax=Geranomyces variabilis TaxID=109894 RepID=A0AAD5XU57_9FUNG|nr:hypothetical protein HDU87_000185 [Geranomyces variabilis]
MAAPQDFLCKRSPFNLQADFIALDPIAVESSIVYEPISSSSDSDDHNGDRGSERGPSHYHSGNSRVDARDERGPSHYHNTGTRAFDGWDSRDERGMRHRNTDNISFDARDARGTSCCGAVATLSPHFPHSRQPPLSNSQSLP